MMKWFRIATIALALGLIWGGLRLPMFSGRLGNLDIVEIYGVAVQVCTPSGHECIDGPAGRGLGGAQTAFMLFTLVLMLFLAIELIQAAREKVLERLPKWTLIAICLYASSLLVVCLVAEDPPGGQVHMTWGILVAMLAIVPAVIAQTNLFDNFASDEELGLLPELPKARALHAPAVTARTPAVVATTNVKQADFGHAGLRVRTDDGVERQVEWTGLRTIVLDTSGARAHLDLVTSNGEALRISATSRVDYRFLPGGIAQNETDNLRRLEQFARERNPAAG